MRQRAGEKADEQHVGDERQDKHDFHRPVHNASSSA
jgi:hypothetical protein